MSSPVLAPPQLVEVTLSLFGGTKTDIAPADCPEGVSPDNQDVVSVPGGLYSRPCLSKLFTGVGGISPAFPNGVTVVYEKTYIQPDGDPLNLFLTSDGKLWVEDVAEFPGIYSQLASTTPGLYAQSATAFGREYIAFSDLLHGQDVPLQFDGTYFDRVTQDGPAAPPAVADDLSGFSIAASPNGLAIFSNRTTLGSPTGLTQSGYLVTAITTADLPGGLQVGDTVVITGAGVAGYNGTFQITAFPPTQLNVPRYFQYINTVSGLAASGGATVAFENAFVTTTVPYSFVVGQLVTIAGAGVSGYNGTWAVRLLVNSTVFVVALNVSGLAASGNGTVSSGGTISQGAHQVVCSFLTRQGAITKPSPSFTWISAGSRRALITNLPSGPANVVARVLSFTGAGGDNFFTLPATITLPNPLGMATVIRSTVINDNTSSSAIVDFSDTALFAGVAIDVVGNNLFDQRTLGPVLGFFAYASRLMTWGDYNKIENFLNLSFDGGYLSSAPLAPLGWTIGCTLGTAAGNGELFSVSTPAGFGWAIWGGGASNTPQGLISQSAYQDSFGAAILQPNTLYDVRAKIATGTLGGTLLVTISSASTGFTTSAIFTLANLVQGGTGQFYTVRLGQTPAVIPPDLIISVSGLNVPASQVVTANEIEVFPEVNPYNNNLGRISYVLNPEAFAQTTGNLGAVDDSSPIRTLSLQKNTAILKTAEGVHVFTDNDFEPGASPGGWVVNQSTRSVGALSLRASDAGRFGTGDGAEDWDIVASKNGVYLFAGAQFWKISQEVSRGALPQSQDPRPTWNDINWAAEHTVWVKNDVENRRTLIGAPINGALTPNIIFVLDYREMDTATQIASSPPVHITIQGKMKSSDLTRKWTRWNIPANGCEILSRPGNQRMLALAGGNGLAIGAGTGYGNVYSLDASKLTDDDYGAMSPYYDTFFFVDHDQEQQLQLGSGRHLYKKITAFITGVGYVSIIPLIDSLYNFQPALSPRLLAQDTNAGNFQGSDLDWTTEIRGERVCFRIGVEPLAGTTDVQLKLQKFIAWMMKDPIAITRGPQV